MGVGLTLEPEVLYLLLRNKCYSVKQIIVRKTNYEKIETIKNSGRDIIQKEPLSEGRRKGVTSHWLQTIILLLCCYYPPCKLRVLVHLPPQMSMEENRGCYLVLGTLSWFGGFCWSAAQDLKKNNAKQKNLTAFSNLSPASREDLRWC